MFRKSIRFSYCDYRFLFYLLPNLFYMILIISLLNILNPELFTEQYLNW